MPKSLLGKLTSIAMRGVVSGVDPERRIVRFVVSTTGVDSHGTIILPTAFEFERYLKNPVFLWAHDACGYGPSGGLPLGKCVELAQGEDGLVAAVEFHEETELAKEAYLLYKGGFLRGASVGGRILEAVWCWQPESEWGDLPEFARTAMREKLCEGVVKRLDLWEISGCAIPSNPDALAASRSAQGQNFDSLCARMENLVDRLEKACSPKKRDDGCPEDEQEEPEHPVEEPEEDQEDDESEVEDKKKAQKDAETPSKWTAEEMRELARLALLIVKK